MMNALALCLVLISLVTAPTPSPVKGNNPTKEEDVIVKEGHRVVVVEFDKQDGNTKVSISPHESQYQPHLSESHGQGQSPRELVCNALGNCKHKVATALGKTKVMVSDKAPDVEEQAAETVSDALGKAKEAVSHKTSQISDKAREVEQAAKEAVGEVSAKAKEAVSDKARRVEGGVKEMAAKAKGGAHNVFESAKEQAKEKVMIERMKIEKEEGRVSLNINTSSKAADRVVEPTVTPPRGADITSTPPSVTRMPERAEQEVVKSRVVVLNARLKKLNTYSSFLNVLTLMVLSWHLVYLSQLLYAAAC
ncbi:hypothetical protein CsSME_00034758 [Camellia sinensis var. sinensis]